MSKNTIFLLVATLLTGFSIGRGHESEYETAWDVMLSQNPDVVDDQNIGWKDRLIMDALSPQQAKAYYSGADPESLTTTEGQSLAAYLADRLKPPAHVYIPLTAPCSLFEIGVQQAGREQLELSASASDLTAQGGSSAGCSISADAAALVLEVSVRALEGLPVEVKLWPSDLPEPAGRISTDPRPLAYETTRVVSLCKMENCQEGSFQLRTSELAALSGHVLGYFRPLLGTDQPGGGGIISFLTESDSTNSFGTGAGTGGTENSVFGAYAGAVNTGATNSFFGGYSGYQNSSGNDNAFFGYAAGYGNSTGYRNTVLGGFAGYNNSTGDNNSYVGWEAGYTNSLEDNNSFFGAYSDGAASITNATAVGYQAQVSQSNSLVLGSIAGLNGATDDVKVGLGTATPETPLHVKRSDGTARLLVEEAAPTTAPRTLYHLKNDGRIRFTMQNTGTTEFWSFTAYDTSFAIAHSSGSSGSEFRLTPVVGNLEIKGEVSALSFNATSDRNQKEGFERLGSQDVLDKVAKLEISEWSYKANKDDRHIGPMGQDFHAVFGLGKDDRHINPLDAAGVALAAIQGLNDKLRAEMEEKDRRIRTLETELKNVESLRSELAEIKAIVGSR